MEFFDVGAVVYILRKCVWWVPDFTVERYRDHLRRLDAHIRTHGAFVAQSTRTLIEAKRPPRHTTPHRPVPDEPSNSTEGQQEWREALSS
jgi:hypothetical protein